jgi:hypothetical protein
MGRGLSLDPHALLHLYLQAHGERKTVCTECGQALEGRQRTWCSESGRSGSTAHATTSGVLASDNVTEYVDPERTDWTHLVVPLLNTRTPRV